MAEYIEKGRLFRAIDCSIHFFEIEKDEIKAIVNSVSTADVVEVVHGRWLTEECDSGDPESYAAFICVQCSQCRYSLGAENGEYGWYYGDPFPLKYCPNCGARMDKGG